MSETEVRPPLAPPRRGLLDRRLRRSVLDRLGRIRGDVIHLEEGSERRRLGSGPEAGGLEATVRVHADDLYLALALRGVLGAGEAYVRGDWTTDDLPRVARILLRNRPVLAGMDGGLARLSRPLLRLYHAARANTRRGSRRNIAAHYDLGNDFYALFLDDTMTYSAGIFERPETTLREASVAKYDRIGRKLALGPAHHVLEIGCGWGGFALHAARRFGCRVTATTISPAQHRYAREAVRKAGLEDRVRILERDYRDLDGDYDRLVSIEMIEAVGHRHLDTYLGAVRDRLRKDGLAAIQAITIADEHYERARRNVDFIKRYVFPGSFIPSMAAIAGALARVGGLRLVHLEEIGPHYATTLRCWRERLLAHRDEVRALGHPDELVRTWEYYLAYCEAGFEERFLGDVQLILARPGDRTPPRLGALA